MTDAFEDLFHLEAEQRGLPGLPYVVVPHPLGGIRGPAVREKALAAVSAVIDALGRRD
ncbi:MAG: hypothetical protein ACKVVT_06550 [Dehalococcoidia bacterium]